MFIIMLTGYFGVGKRPIHKLESSESFKLNDPFQPFPSSDGSKGQEADPFAPSGVGKEMDSSNFANFNAVSMEIFIYHK